MRQARRSLRRADVGVLVLCAALVMTSLAAVGPQGRRRARAAVCLANLRQWGGVFDGYIQRNNGRFFTGEASRGYWWPRELDDEHKNWKQMKIWFCSEADRPMLDENGVYQNLTPTFAAWGIYHGMGLSPHGLAGSYSINGYTMDIPESSQYEGGVPARNGWRGFDSVTGAEGVPLFIDAMRFDLWPLETNGPSPNEFAAWSGNNMARCAINRHNGAVNSLFLDGSARKVGLKELWTLKWHRSFNTEGPWTRAGGAESADWPEWMRGFKDY